jgi:error-prone DNA polymerase
MMYRVHCTKKAFFRKALIRHCHIQRSQSPWPSINTGMSGCIFTVNVTVPSGCLCTIEKEEDTLFVRMGLNYLRGLRRSVAEEIVAARAQQPFSSLRDLIRRVPGLNKKEIAALAEIGALNALPEHEADRQRRGALWQASAAARNTGPLLESATGESELSPLVPMTPTQRTFSDFTHSGLTLGKHPIAFHRDQLQAMDVLNNDLVKK